MSELHPRMQEIKQWLHSLEWDGVDRSAAVASCLAIDPDMFISWLTGVTEKVLFNNAHPKNKTLAIISPPATGKTIFLKWLSRGLWNDFYSEFDMTAIYACLEKCLLVEGCHNKIDWSEVNQTTSYIYTVTGYKNQKDVDIPCPVYPRGTVVYVSTHKPKKPLDPAKYLVATPAAIRPDYQQIDINQLWAQAAAAAFPF